MLDRVLKQFGKQNGEKREETVSESAEIVSDATQLPNGEGIERLEHPGQNIPQKLVKSPDEPTTLVFANSKGGVGKSTLAAAGAAEPGGSASPSDDVAAGRR